MSALRSPSQTRRRLLRLYYRPVRNLLHSGRFTEGPQKPAEGGGSLWKDRCFYGLTLPTSCSIRATAVFRNELSTRWPESDTTKHRNRPSRNAINISERRQM